MVYREICHFGHCQRRSAPPAAISSSCQPFHSEPAAVWHGALWLDGWRHSNRWSGVSYDVCLASVKERK